MYAIAFDLDTEQLRQLYPNANWNNAYFDIRRELETRGFRWWQGSVYFGNDDISATDCVKATMDLDALFPWFRPSVRDIRMMQITEEDTLMDFLGYEAGPPRATASVEGTMVEFVLPKTSRPVAGKTWPNADRGVVRM